MPHDYKKKDSPMNGWLNVIYKMMQDGHCNEVIYFYIRRQPDFSGNDGSLVRCIHLIGKNNFPGRSEFHPKQLMEQTHQQSIYRLLNYFFLGIQLTLYIYFLLFHL